MRKWIFLLILSGLVVAALLACTAVNSSSSSCPSFAAQQLLPQTGDAETQYVIWVSMNDTTTNATLTSVVAQAFFANGQSANNTLDLVQEETNPLRYLRTFTGSQVCASGTCTLYFHVIATSKSNCQSAYDSPLFQVVISATPADDDTE